MIWERILGVFKLQANTFASINSDPVQLAFKM